MNNLINILKTKRAHGSVGERKFRTDLGEYLTSLGYVPYIKGEGNIVVTLGESRTMFSCHIDTCHSREESDGSDQELFVDSDMDMVFVKDSSCLGADDGVGIHICLRMIEAGVPGTYVFHVAEEVGGLGSMSIASDESAWVSGFDRAVAFDRAVKPGWEPEVITHQSGMRCASDEAGRALALALNAACPALGYVTSTKGVFTDTLNYSELVPEGFNLGCFYDLQHSPSEYVDLGGVQNLLDACLKIDWEALPVVRVPGPDEDDWGRAAFGWGRSYEDDEFDLVDEAIYAWEKGDSTVLLDLVASEIYPEDPEFAHRFINLKRLTDEVIEDAYRRGIDALVESLVDV